MDEQLRKAPCGFFVMDQYFHITDVNDMMASMLDMEVEALIGRHIHDLLTKPSKVYFQTYFTPILSLQEEVRELYTMFQTTKGSVPSLLNAAVRDGMIECAVIEMKVRNEYEEELVTSKKNAERILHDTDEAYMNLLGVMNEYKRKRKELTELNLKLSELSITDPLTHLKNRRFLEQRMSFLLHLAENEDVPFSVAMLDIDHFKKINDEFGHMTGDDILKEFSNVCTSETRQEDWVIRVGGEEFVIVMPSMTLKEASEAVECIREKVEERPWTHGEVTMSAGVAAYENGDTLENLLEKVDKALYHAKQDGRNRISIYTMEETKPYSRV